MLDQLVKLVEQNANKAIVQNEAIPNQFNTAAIQEVAGGIFNAMKGQVSNGNTANVVDLFKNANQGPLNNNAVVNEMIASVTGNFASKFGVPSQVASNVVSNLIPTVMTQLVQKTNDPSDSSFDLGSMITSMAPGNPIQQKAGNPIQQ